MRTVSPVDAAWLVLESRDTPMHVGGLFEFTLPPNAPADYLKKEFDLWRAPQTIPPPWNLRLVEGPLLGPRLPLMREVRDVDLDYHIRHSALPHPGGQRELGVLVSRLHSHQLDLHRPLWEVHLIEGLEGNRFALYSKTHHSLIDGVSGMRLIMRALSADPYRRGMAPFWAVGEGARRERKPEQNGSADGLLRKPLSLLREGASSLVGLSRASADLALAAVDERPLQAPYRAPDSVLGGHLTGQRRFATQQYELDKIKALARAGECTINDVVLYLSGSALRRYLQEHARIPERTLTAGIPVNLREADDQSMGTAVGMIVAELGTNIKNPTERLEAIKRSTAEAKRHLRELPSPARASYALLINGPYIAGLLAGLGAHAPIPFNLGVSNVPGPTGPLYWNGSRLDALYPLSLLLHGNALNITCVSYAGTLNFGFTGARDNLPHLQRLAVYMGESLAEIERVLLKRRGARGAGRSASSNARKGASKNARTVAG
jgi:diacylglycerol O-acyltransferase / wax synthase